MLAIRLFRIQATTVPNFLPLRATRTQRTRASQIFASLHSLSHKSSTSLTRFNSVRRVLSSPRLRPFKVSLPRRSYSSKPDQISQSSQHLTFSQRFRKLGREYGWSATGVYFLLSALDFPFCFAAVRWLGPERVGHAEKTVVEGIKTVIPDQVKRGWSDLRAAIKNALESGRKDTGMSENRAEDERRSSATGQTSDDLEYDHGIAMAEIENQGDHASIWTQLALAYAIHKSFIFIRIPLTVAVTPKVVKVLRGWGWDIGKRKPTGG